MQVNFVSQLPKTNCNIPMAGTAEFQDWRNNLYETKMPKTNCNIPMAGTPEFKEWKAQQADTFNGKAVEEKKPSLLNKIVDFIKGEKAEKEEAHLPKTNCNIPMAGTEEFQAWKKQQAEKAE